MFVSASGLVSLIWQIQDRGNGTTGHQRVYSLAISTLGLSQQPKIQRIPTFLMDLQVGRLAFALGRWTAWGLLLIKIKLKQKHWSNFFATFQLFSFQANDDKNIQDKNIQLLLGIGIFFKADLIALKLHCIKIAISLIWE